MIRLPGSVRKVVGSNGYPSSELSIVSALTADDLLLVRSEEADISNSARSRKVSFTSFKVSLAKLNQLNVV